MRELPDGDAATVNPHESTETGRVEAFSDGVFAVAITLLGFNLHVPEVLGNSTSLAAALLAQWPAFAAFALSFGLIGIMWVNHHRLFVLIDRVDHTLMVLNMLLLLGVTFVPFPTGVVAAYFATDQERSAALLYNGTFAFIAIVYFVVWDYAVRHPKLLHPHAHGAPSRIVSRIYLLGPPGYLLAVALSLVNAYLGVVLNMLLAVVFALPPQSLARLLGERGE